MGEAGVPEHHHQTVIYGEGKVAQPLVQALTGELYPEFASDVEAVLHVDLPQHRLLKVARDSTPTRLCSALLGAYSKQGVGICRHTRQKKYQGVLDACLRLAACRKGDLATPFTSISLNEGAYGEHVDSNWGDSVVLALGDYTGGELKVGSHTVESRGCWVRFDATTLHEVLPYQGLRRSVTLFVTRRWHALSGGDVNWLANR
eukprot:6474886-Amphidinium_carterae.1